MSVFAPGHAEAGRVAHDRREGEWLVAVAQMMSLFQDFVEHHDYFHVSYRWVPRAVSLSIAQAF
jgi:hypothetical protein